MMLLAIMGLQATTFAQEKTHKFDNNRMFIGGSIIFGLGFGNTSQFQIGANPELGYSITDWWDAGINFNTIYNNIKYLDGGINVTQKSFNYGVGVFTRLHIGDKFFFQVQPEHNWIDYTISAPGYTDYKQTVKAGSFLAGIGYGTRNVGRSNFFTVIMVDFRNEKYSPYRTNTGDVVPVIRGGVNFYFAQWKRDKTRNGE